MLIRERIIGEIELKRRKKVFGVLLNEEEIKLLKERANRFGMSSGAYLRFLFHREIQSRKKEDYSITKE